MGQRAVIDLHCHARQVPDLRRTVGYGGTRLLGVHSGHFGCLARIINYLFILVSVGMHVATVLIACGLGYRDAYWRSSRPLRVREGVLRLWRKCEVVVLWREGVLWDPVEGCRLWVFNLCPDSLEISSACYSAGRANFLRCRFVLVEFATRLLLVYKLLVRCIVGH